MDFGEKNSWLAPDGQLRHLDLDDLKKLLDYMAIKRNNCHRGKKENVEPCCKLIDTLIKYPKKYSQQFVINFLILSVSSGYIELCSLMRIINSHNIFERFEDEKYSELKFELLKTIFVAVKTYLKNETKNNFLEIYISDKEFDEIMLFIKDIIVQGGSSVINYFVDDFKAVLHCFQDVGRALSFQWISNERRPEIEIKSKSRRGSLFYIDDDNIASMIETSIRMFKYPGLYDANDKKKLWIEHHACEKLKNKYQFMVLFYTKLFGGEYRKIDKKLTRPNLSSDLVLRILSFLGLNGVDYELQQGRF